MSFPIRKEEYMIDPVNGLPLPVYDFFLDYRVHASVFAGHAKAWLEYSKLFHSTLESFVKHGRFAGKEQNIMSSVAVLYPNSTLLIRPKKFVGHIYI